MLLLAQFIGLQLLDALTTLKFLEHGVSEGNPLIRAMLGMAGHPALALALPKLLSIGLGVYAWHSGRYRLLGRMNLLFAGCVTWNLLAIAAAHHY